MDSLQLIKNSLIKDMNDDEQIIFVQRSWKPFEDRIMHVFKDDEVKMGYFINDYLQAHLHKDVAVKNNYLGFEDMINEGFKSTDIINELMKKLARFE